MIRNFRVAVQKELWEFPGWEAGIRGSRRFQAAGRKLEEETGLSPLASSGWAISTLHRASLTS